MRTAPFPIAIQQVHPSAKPQEFPGFPRPVREVHQIEVTSRCNLRCVYCPHPKMPRPKIDMSWGVFEDALQLVLHFVKHGTQTELALTGIGEPLMHPTFVEMVSAARQVVGERPLTFSTNGILLDEQMCLRLKPYNPRIYVSMHRPERAGPAAVLAQKHGILAGINNAFVTSAFNWGGKVDWHVSAPESVCEYLHSGWCVVLADGRVTTCCLDSEGTGVVGTVWDAPEALKLSPYSLCSGCHMRVPEATQVISA